MDVGTIHHTYKFIARIGQGGQSSVYMAEHLRLHSIWAIKEIRIAGRDPVKLLAEPDILKNLRHPAIPRIADTFQEEERLYIVMDYIEGCRLDQYLKDAGKIKEDLALEWAKQLNDVLFYLHSQKPPILHCDMKPSNIILGTDGRLHLIDFGIAREQRWEGGSNKIALTKGYAAPEQYQRNSFLDVRTDIYGMGATLYHLITGKSPNEPPYEFLPVRHYNPDASYGITEIINRCIESEPDKRFQSDSQVTYALDHIEDANEIYRRKKRNEKVRLAVASSLFLLLIVGAGGVFLIKQKAEYEGYLEKIEDGIEATSQKDYPLAKVCFDDAIAMRPDEVEGYIARARLLAQQYQYQEAINYIRETVLIKIPSSANDARLNYLLGTIYADTNNLEEAAYYFSRAGDIAPDYTEYSRAAIIYLAESGQVDAAQERLNILMRENSGEDIVWYIQALVSWRQGEHDDALDSAARCIKLAAEDTMRKNTVLLMADICEDYPSWDNAWLDKEIDLLEQGERLFKDGPYIDISERKAECYYKRAVLFDGGLQDMRKASEGFEDLLSMGYARPHIYNNLAVICHYLGDDVGAEAFMKEKEVLEQKEANTNE